MEGAPVISPDVLARYAADAAREVEGVAGLGEGPLHRGGVAVSQDGARVLVRVALELAWGAAAATVGADVQRSVADYLERMAGIRPAAVDVVVESVARPGAPTAA
ncbi:MAG TPA: Asp23/Gls24 family envelope stress response protein [Gaiellaceae bacterium]|nr:Asp23/Gls24 family envelope stress response protein [Gaiellaceae bacterium]